MSQARQAAGLIKTPLGEAEIRTRKLAVRGARRQLLILTNGEHDRAALIALAGKIGASEEDVDQLLGLGLIAAAGDPEPVAPPAVEAQLSEPAGRSRRSLAATKMYLLDVTGRLGGEADDMREALRAAATRDELCIVLGWLEAWAADRAAGDFFERVLARTMELLPLEDAA